MGRRKYPTGMTSDERRAYLEETLTATATFRPGDAIALEELRALWAVEREYWNLLMELPGSFDTPALDAYRAAQEGDDG